MGSEHDGELVICFGVLLLNKTCTIQSGQNLFEKAAWKNSDVSEVSLKCL